MEERIMSDLDITKKVFDKLCIDYFTYTSEDEIELNAYTEKGFYVGNIFFNLDGSFQEE
jgi:hypothetical protein